MNNQSLSKIIGIELVLFIFLYTVSIITGLLGFDFYPYIFLFLGILLGSIATFGYIRLKQGMIK